MASNSQADPFDTLLTLEDTLYSDAYALGCADGARAGRIEGRIFGLEQGFEKFAALGALHGRACVWGSRIVVNQRKGESQSSGLGSNEREGPEKKKRDPKESVEEKRAENETNTNPDTDTSSREKDTQNTPTSLPTLPANPRLDKHISTLYALTDSLTFDTANSEEAVADFDDRFKRAGAKAKIIERIIGPSATSATTATLVSASTSTPTSISPDRDSKKKGRIGNVKLSGEGKKKTDDSMEDFSGPRLLR